jgi:fatty-acyl-CoA synthase
MTDPVLRRPLPQHSTFRDALDAAHAAGDSRGMTFVDGEGGERFIGFRSLIVLARARGRKLLALGLRPGDRMALAIPQPAEFVVTFIAAASVGIVPVPIYPPVSLGRLGAYLDGTVRILKAASADVLITTPQLQQILWSVVPRVTTLRDLVTLEALDALSEVDAAAVDALPRAAPADPLFLQFTSGSTAAPRGVVVTHGSLCANGYAIMQYAITADPAVDVCVSWLPLFHDMGLIGFVLVPLAFQMSVVILPTLAFLKRPTLWMDLIHKHRGTLTFAPNFAYARLAKRASDADLARWDLSSVRVMGCGAEPINATALRTFVDRFSAGARLPPTALVPCYGMAEATLAMSFARLGQPLRVDEIDADASAEEGRAVPALPGAGRLNQLVSCGQALPGHELAVFTHGDAEATPTRVGEREIGEIAFRGPSVAAGYFRDPEAGRATFRGGWLFTGDLGYLVDGEVFISGRKKDLLIVNGRNYHPQSIEWVVEEVPGIRKGNVVAFSVPGQASEEVAIAAETAERSEAERERLVEAVKTAVKLSIGLAPSDVVLVGPGALPKTSSGKLQRSRTRAQYLAGNIGAEGVRSAGVAAERLSLVRYVAASWIGRLRHRSASLFRRGSRSRSPSSMTPEN